MQFEKQCLRCRFLKRLQHHQLYSSRLMKYVWIIKYTPLSHNVARGGGGTSYKGLYLEAPQKGVLSSGLHNLDIWKRK